MSGELHFFSEQSDPESSLETTHHMSNILPKSAMCNSSIPTHIVYSRDKSDQTSIKDHDSQVEPVPLPHPSAATTTAAAAAVVDDLVDLDHQHLLNIQMALQSSPRTVLLRKFLELPRHRLRIGVQKRTQRVKLFLSSHRRSFSPHLRFRNRRERITTISPNSINLKKRSSLIIRADHPYKILFDLFTVILTLISIYVAHISIRDRSTYEYTPFFIFNKCWFLLDIVLNFFTANIIVGSHDGMLVAEEDARAVWALYLTSWFAVDMLSLIPWERLYLKPVIEMQNRRNLLVKSFFRTKAAIRLSTVLRAWHFQYFGRVAHNTKHHLGMNTQTLLKLIIKYVPKYLLFYRNMKGILIIKALRLVHFMMKALRAFRHLRVYLKELFRKRQLSSVVKEQLGLGKNNHFAEMTFRDLSFDDDVSDLNRTQRSASTLLSDGSQDQVASEGDIFEQDAGSSFRTGSDDDLSVRGNDSWSELVSVDTFDSRDFNNETFDANSRDFNNETFDNNSQLD